MPLFKSRIEVPFRGFRGLSINLLLLMNIQNSFKLFFWGYMSTIPRDRYIIRFLSPDIQENKMLFQ
jgi:hypothetical protein